MRVLLFWLVVGNVRKLNSTAGHAIKVIRPQSLFRLSYLDLAQVTIDSSLYSNTWDLLGEHLIDILLGLSLALVSQGIDGNLLEIMLQTIHRCLPWRKMGLVVIWLLGI